MVEGREPGEAGMTIQPRDLARRDTARLEAYRQNLNFYHGEQWPKTSTQRQLVFNYAKVAIDKVTSYLMQGLNFACYATEDSEESRARVNRTEQLLRDVYEQNKLQQIDWETEVDAAVLGDGCYKVTWDAADSCIRVTAPDVSGIFAWWWGDNLAKVWRVASQYRLSGDEVAMLYGNEVATPSARNDRERAARNDRERAPANDVRLPSLRGAQRRSNPGAGATVTEVWTEREFQLWLDNELVESKPNPYGFIPFVIFPNLREPKQFWGNSDIPSLVQPQRELNRAMSQLSRILELSGNPIAVLENVTSAEDIRVQPGATWALPEDARAYLLDLLQGGGIRLHIDYIDLIYRALHDISETPRAAYGGTNKELSGAALQIELASLMQKVTRKRTIRTNAYHQRNEMILKLAEKYLGEDFQGITHRAVWAGVLPTDVTRQAQDQQLLVRAGVHSRRTAMDEMGIQDPEAEFSRWLEERRRILQLDQEFRARSSAEIALPDQLQTES